ncbi:hypothetical protein [Pseudolysinimonas sp.]|uniref:hypothetical protein n=1 Tax=Pseudolysinimonas sp. TaxID=2680009 RepID=UPI003F7D2D58
MSSGFWHPVQELRRLPGGWKMRRTRFGNPEGAIVPAEDGLEVWLRRGDEAVPIGRTTSLRDAAVALWRYGREDQWPGPTPRLAPFYGQSSARGPLPQ